MHIEGICEAGDMVLALAEEPPVGNNLFAAPAETCPALVLFDERKLAPRLPGRPG